MIKKIKIIMQEELSECGLACINMVLNYYGMNINIDWLRNRHHISIMGMTLRDMKQVIETYECRTKVLKIERENLKTNSPLILHWEHKHYVVLESISGSKAKIFDPAAGIREITLEEFDLKYTGIAILVEPTKNFKTIDSNNERLLQRFLRRFLFDANSLLLLIIYAFYCEAAIITSAFLIRDIFNIALRKGGFFDSYVHVLMILILFFSCMYIKYLKSVFQSDKFKEALFDWFYKIQEKVFRSQLSLFSRHSASDIFFRFNCATKIEESLSNNTIDVITEGVFSLMLIIAIVFFIPSLAVVILPITFIFLYFSFRIGKKLYHQKQGYYYSRDIQDAFLWESIKGIEDIKIYDEKNARLKYSRKLFSDSLYEGQLVQRIESKISTATFLYSLTLRILILLNLSYTYTVSGLEFSNIIIIYSLSEMMIAKLTNLSSKISIFSEIAQNFKKISYFDKLKKEKADLIPKIDEIDLLYKNISFSYSDFDSALINNFELHLVEGDTILIRGPNGKGKSTLSKVLMGLYENIQGDIYVNQSIITKEQYCQITGLFSLVSPNQTIYSGTIIDNITMFSLKINYELLIHAIEKSNLEVELGKFPSGLNAIVNNMGSSLSLGQRQKIFLARALYADKKIIIFDEAASNLDDVSRVLLMDFIKSTNKTKIIISHDSNLDIQFNKVIDM